MKMRCVGAVVLALVVQGWAAEGAGPAGDDVAARVAREMGDLDAFYQECHKNPELSLQEEKSAKRLAGELKKAGYEVTENVGGFGLVAVMKNGAGKTLLIRADMDALPVKEETGAVYASVATGVDGAGKSVPVMHACGHDVHMTNLVGVARMMAAMKDRWSGTLILIGQPAEEIGEGSKAMMKAGLFEKFPRPDWCLALHVDAELEAGKVGFTAGYAMANADGVDIVVRGAGGHGAAPHTTRDPVVLAAQIVLGLQTIASRETKPGDPVVVTVGSIQGGTKRNVIPDEVTLQLTVRTYSEETRQKTHKAIDRVAKGMATAAGVPAGREPVVTVHPDGTPKVYNDPELVKRVVGVFEGVVGKENVVPRDPSMGAEDFGRLAGTEPKIPIFMYRLGSVPAEKAEAAKKSGEALPSLHSSKFLPEREKTIKTGVVTMTSAALELLKK